MILEPDRTAAQPVWVLRPTRSFSWAQAYWLIGGVGAFLAVIGGGFYAMGYPLVLPFSGIEIAALSTAFYLVLREGECQEVVRLDDAFLVVERGRGEVEQTEKFDRFWVTVELIRPHYRSHPSRLTLRCQGRTLEVGRFLTENERKRLAVSLINAVRKNR